MAEEARIIIDAQLQFRHDSEAAWLEYDPVLKAGEPAYTLGYPDRFKLGDGQSKWSELPYIKPGEGGGSQSYESLTWSAIKGLTAGDPSVLPQAFAVKQAYNELKSLIPALDDYYSKTEVDSRIPSLAGYATETFVNTAIANLINGAPTTLDTLKEIADALADNADVVEALESAIGTKADKTTVDALDTRLDSAEANISTNTTNITAQGKTIASHTTSINTLSSDVSGLKTSVSDLEDLFDSDGKALKAVTADNASKLGGQLPSYYATASSVTTLQGYFTNGVAKNADKLDGNDSTYFATASALTTLTTRVSTAETNITNLTNNKLNKSVWDSVFEIDANGNLKVKVGIYSTKFISSRKADPNTGGGSGGAFSLYTWAQVKALTSEVGGVAPTAYALKQAYNEINTSLDGKASTSSVTALTTRVASLESKATSVSVSQTLTTGTEIGKITIDGVSKTLYAPSIAGLASESWVSNNYLAKSGGTISLATMAPLNIQRTSSGAAAIAYRGPSSTYGYIGFNDTTAPKWWDSSFKEYTLLHSGNYSDYALPLTGGTLYNGVDNSPLVVKGVAEDAYIRFQRGNDTSLGAIGVNVNLGPVYWDSANMVNRILIHSGNIGSYNAGSATKLKTARTIWGQSFDGTGNVNGNLTLGNAVSILGTDSSATARSIMSISSENSLIIGHGSSAAGIPTYINGSTLYFRYGTSRTLGMLINSSGNVTIGASDLAGTSAKLFVNGVVKAKNDFVIDRYGDHTYWANGFYIRGEEGTSWGIGAYSNDKATEYYYIGSYGSEMITIRPNGNVLIGTTTDNGGKLQIEANVPNLISLKRTNAYAGAYIDYIAANAANRQWRVGASDNGSFVFENNNSGTAVNAMIINSSGNVLIGTTTDAGYKLDVAGTFRATGNATVNGLTATTGTFSGALSANGLTLSSNLTLYYQIFFTRASHCYIWGASGSAFHFGSDAVGGTSPAYASLSIYSDSVTPGARNNAVSLGSASYRWSTIYGVNGDFSGTIYSATGVKSAGYVSARGADSSSDRRLKDNIAPLRNALNYVLGTNYVSFDWKDTREKSIGIIAQEEMGREWGCLVQKHSETYSYLYGQHTALLGAAIQEEDKKVEELKAEISLLKAEVKDLKTRLNS